MLSHSRGGSGRVKNNLDYSKTIAQRGIGGGRGDFHTSGPPRLVRCHTSSQGRGTDWNNTT